MDLLDKHNEVNEVKLDRALRPQLFEDYIGQEELVKKLQIAIDAAMERDEPLDHLLLNGSAGLGKTTMAHVIANESACNCKSVVATSIRNISDLLDLLTKLKKRDILFIDEIHALDKRMEEVLYGAMEDYIVHVKLGNQEIVKININPFCMVGATTVPGQISQPLRDRFGICYTMEFYSVEQLALIIKANINKLKLNVQDEAAIANISQRSRGTPRVANRLLRRVRDFAQIKNNNQVTNDIVDAALELEGIDKIGLSTLDRKYLNTLYTIYACGPCGPEPLSASCGEDKTTIVNFIEPYLTRIGFVARTPRGRVLTGQGMQYIIENR